MAIATVFGLVVLSAMATSLNVPVGDLDGWTVLSYRNIPADGDNTGSRFDLHIERITLQSE